MDIAGAKALKKRLAASGVEAARVRTESGKLVCERCEIANSAFARARGLLGRSGLEPDGGMLIDPAGSVHMFFMRFPIDVAATTPSLASGIASGRGGSRPPGVPSPRSSFRPEGLPR